MAKDRQFFVDQSQSMNLFIDTPSVVSLAKIHMYSWKQGLKTGMYYLRTKPAVNAVKVTLAPPGPAPKVLAPPSKATKWPPLSAEAGAALRLSMPAKTETPSDVAFVCNSETGVCFTCSS